MSKQKNGFAVLKFLCACIFTLTAIFVYPQENEKSIISLRLKAMDFYRKEIAAASLNEVSPEDIGVWKEVLDAALFMLIRSTELYRGKMRVLIEDNRIAKCKIFPDGTILISTAIFDYIDAKLADSQNKSPRRIKNFNAEREQMLASFLAFEAADFALDNKTVYFNMYGEPSKADILKRFNLQTDYFAVILLKLAAYDSNAFYNHLEELKDIQNNPINSKQFESFFADTFTPQQRITNLLKMNDEAEALADELFYIIDALQNENETTIEDAKQRLITLKTHYPNNLYIKRLAALTFHKKWAAVLNAYEEQIITAYPAAMQTCKKVNTNFPILNNNPETLLVYQTVNEDEKQTIPGNINEYDEAIRSYKSYLNSIYESGLASSYAVLLYYSPNVNDKASAISLAEQAALNEHGTESLTAAVNYSALLYLSGKDYTTAKILLENILNSPSASINGSLFLRTGKIIDERIVLFNYARMLFGLNEHIKAEKARNKLQAFIFPLEEYTAVPVKKIRLGGTADDLTEFWGNPDSIKYNYFSEKWKYGFLNAEVIINTVQNGEIEKIIIFNNSILSLPNDLRTGETRKSFEAFFGKPLYHSGDTEIYLYKANRIQVLYINEYIRTVYLTKAEK